VQTTWQGPVEREAECDDETEHTGASTGCTAGVRGAGVVLEKGSVRIQRSHREQTGSQKPLDADVHSFQAQTVVSTEVKVDRTQVKVDRTQVKVDRIQHQLLLDRLAPIKSAFYNSSEAAPACLPGTRMQLLADIQTWMNDPSTKSIYWLDGIAGTGKTTIAQSVSAMAAERLAATFFFSRTAESSERRQTAPVIPTLAYQLAQKHGTICSRVYIALESKPDIRTSRMEDQAHILLSEPLITVADGLFPLPLLVVLDGLDECDKDARSGREGGQLISILLETFRGLPFCVKMFITSRPEPTVQKMFGEISEFTHRLALHRDIDEGVVHGDIGAYLRDELSKLAKKRCIPLPFPSDGDFKTLADRAGTLFIYVRTVVEYISSDLGGSPEEQLAELLQLNVSAGSRTFASLDAVYRQTLQKALSAFGDSAAEVQQFQDVLACLVLLRRSATVSDLAVLTGTRQAGCAKVLRCLSSLLVYSHQAEEAIRVIHPSLADFLTDPARCSYAEFMIGTTSETKLASALWKCWKETANASWLEEAIKLDHGAVILCPRGDPNRDATCSDVAHSLLGHYDYTRDASLLEDMIELDREALALRPDGHPDRAWSCENLANSLKRHFDHTRDISELDEVIQLEREALVLRPKGHPDHARSCANLAVSLTKRYDHTGDISLLDEMIQLEREALVLRPEGHPDHARSCAGLATSLQRYYDHTGDVSLLDEMIQLDREALALCPEGHPDHAWSCANLAISLQRCYDHTRDISLLGEMIQLDREALALRHEGHPDHAESCANLAVSLQRCYDHTGDVSLLDEMIKLDREALAVRREGHTDHARSCAGLATSLQRYYDHTGDISLLDEMIQLEREALALRPDGHPDHALSCGCLANSLRRYFDHTGDIALLDEMITLEREALALCPKGHPHHATWRGNLTADLRRRFDKTGDVVLLDEIAELEREAAYERSG
jgi:hypothetical protein